MPRSIHIPVHSRLFAAILLAVAMSVMTGCARTQAAGDGDGAGKNTPVTVEAAVTNWPVFRGNAQATGVAEGTLPKELSLLWKFPVEKGSFESTPIVDGNSVYIGDMDGTFYALDLTTGQQLWKFDKGKEKIGFTSAAAVRDGLVYAGDIDGELFCLNVATGEKKWSVKSEGEIDSAPNFYHGNLLFGSQDATLYCVDAKTGVEQWKHTIGDQIRCSPTVVQDRCFLAGCDGKLHVVNLHNGEEIGAMDIDSPTGSTPAVAGDFIYFGTEGATFFCVNWKTLKEVWHWSDKKRSMSIRSSAALTADAVVFGGRDKMVHAFNPLTGDRLWDFTTKGKIDGSPVVVENRVFVGSSDGRVYGFNLKSGEKVWEYEAGGSFVGSPSVASGRLLIANSDGVVYCFGEKK
jgi:outer membrane protein assembly factor BamB